MAARLIFIFLVAISSCCVAFNDLGSLDNARKQHAAIFEANAVVECTVNGVPGYAYNGSVRKNFAGSAVPGDLSLYRMAVLAAKRNLLNYLTRKDKTKVVWLSGAFKMYEYAADERRCVVCFVPKACISIMTRPIPPVPAPKVAVQPPVSQSVAEAPKHSVAEAAVAPSVKPLATPGAAVPQKVEPSKGGSPVEAKDPSDVEKEDEDDSLLDKYLRELEQRPFDCSLLAQIALVYQNQGDLESAGEAYAGIVELVRSNETMDKEEACGWLLEAAAFAEKCKNDKSALEYYRLILTLNGKRRWENAEAVSEASRKIAQLLAR